MPTNQTPAATGDTLAQWLYQRFAAKSTDFWADLTEEDRDYWEHEARAVRRAVARGGFKEPLPGATAGGA